MMQAKTAPYLPFEAAARFIKLEEKNPKNSLEVWWDRIYVNTKLCCYLWEVYEVELTFTTSLWVKYIILDRFLQIREFKPFH